MKFLLATALLSILISNDVAGFTLMGGVARMPSSSFSSTSMIARGSFVGSNKISMAARRRSSSAKSSSTTLSMVIDRLSNDCVEALKESHTIGNKIGLKSLTNEIIFVGLIGEPERARATLKKYMIEYDDVKEAAIRTVQYKPGLDADELKGPNPTLDQALPFSEEGKVTLNRACEIADSMESSVVRSEHMLLALMGYNNGNRIERVPVMEVLQDMRSIRRNQDFKVSNFCNDLVNDLPLTAISASDDVIVRDKVVIGAQTETNTNTLQEVGVDLTQMALEGKLDMVFGRDKEIKTCLRTLGRRRKNNPCLIGDPGVGKTAVAEAIAQVLANGILELEEIKEKSQPQNKIRERIGSIMNRGKKDDKVEANGGEDVSYELPECPKSLLGARLINIELAGLVAGTSNRGDFETKIKNLIKEASNANVILFIDEIHNLIGTGGGGDGAMNAANLLKPALARGELRVLGATTTPEYRRYIEKDGALERRFQPLEVTEPSVFETLDILAAVSPKYEEFHGVEYTYNALLSAAKLSNRYISDRFLPDKAIDLVDEAGSMVKMADENEEQFYVTEDAVANVISEMTGIPLGKLDTDEKSRLRNLEENIGERIKGQENAVRAVSKSIRRARSGMRDGRRPVASLLFCGPTGVGKTELCKSLAETYFGQEKDMIRIDMSEYMDRFSTSRLIGAPPGYVGYEEGGQLTEAVRRKPHSVILFDELEKAHEDVLNLLLQIMDEGTLTDGKGRTISFKNNIFVMTSNIGSKEILQAVKGSDDGDSAQLTSDVVKSALEESMRPELLNRIDEIVVFSPLAYENLKDIAGNLIGDTIKRAKDDQSITLTVSDNIAEIVTRDSLSVASLYGARPIRRGVQRYLEDTLAEAIMSEFIDEGDSVDVNLKDPNSGKKVVEIKRQLDGKSLLIDVDEDSSISRESDDFQAAFGDLPKLGGPPKKDPDSFQ